MDRATFARIGYRLLRGELPDPADGIPFGVAATAFGHGEFNTLDEACGLQRRPGQRSVATVVRHQVRDQLLRECASRCFPGLPVAQQAARIIEAVTRYRAASWKIDERREAMPASYAGTTKEFAFRLCQAGLVVPKLRRLIDILGQGECNELPSFHCIGG